MSSTLDINSLRDALAHFATGITVATVLAEDGSPHGLTVSSFTSVSMDPPLVLICVDYACTVLAHFRRSHTFGVNVLSEGQRDLSVAFSVKPEGRFDDVRWYSGVAGVPLIHDCLAHFECRVERILEAGDHVIFFGHPLQVEVFPGEPLLYFNRSYHSLRK